MNIKFINRRLLINEKVNDIMKIVDKKVKNKNMYDYINENINYISNKKMKIKASENGLTIKNKINKDLFEIVIIPNTIFTKCTYWNGLYTEVKQIDYLDNTITLKESSIKNIMDIESNIISSTDNDEKNMIYIDNKLVYSEENKSSIYYDTCRGLLYSDNFNETYILGNNAVKINMSINNDEGTKTYYFKTNNFDVRNFNTREFQQDVYVTSFEEITSDEYLNFLTNFNYNNQVSKVKEKKFIKY